MTTMKMMVDIECNTNEVEDSSTTFRLRCYTELCWKENNTILQDRLEDSFLVKHTLFQFTYVLHSPHLSYVISQELHIF